MKTFITLLCEVLLIMFSFDFYAQSGNSLQGNYTGNQVWDGDTIRLNGNVAIDGVLLIKPGTCIEFQGHYELMADSILAIGSSSDSITFTIHDTLGFSNINIPDGSWKRICATSYMELNFCRIMFGKYIEGDDPFPSWGSGILKIKEESATIAPLVIKNSFISDNLSSRNMVSIVDASNTFEITGCVFINNKFNFFRLFSYGISKIDKCSFYGNSGEMNNLIFNGSYFERNTNLGLSVASEGTLFLNDCIFKSNDNLAIVPGSAYSNFKMNNTTIIYNENLFLSCYGISGLEISGNVICSNNLKSGILILECTFGSDHVKIVNNTFYGNHVISGTESFLTLSNNGYVLFCNNILSKNISPENFQISFKDYNSNDILSLVGDFRNNLIEGGLGAIQYSGTDGLVENNLDEDPLFVNPAIGDFHLKNVSPCINTGTTDIDGYYFPPEDPEGIPRVLDFEVEIGAYEFNLGHLVFLTQPMGGNFCSGSEFSVSTNAFGGVAGYQWRKDGIIIPNKTGNTLFFASIDTSDTGNYNCNIITADSVVSTNSVRVEVYPLPTVFLGKDTTIYNTDTFTLDAGEGFESYLWNTGMENKFLMVSLNEIGVFEYWVQVTDNHGCNSMDTILVTVDKLSALPGQPSSDNIKLFPNPTSGLVHIVFSKSMNRNTITVTDLEGKAVLKRNFEMIEAGVEYQIDLSELDNGIYLMILDKYPIRIVKNSGLR